VRDAHSCRDECLSSAGCRVWAIAVADEGRGRLTTADRTAAVVERAQRALLELRARAAADGRAAEEARQIEEAHRAVEHAPDAAAVAELVE
jgi:hypothetical protein